MKYKIIMLVFFATTFCNAQIGLEDIKKLREIPLISGSYTYFNQSFGEIGVRNINVHRGFRLGANVLVGSTNTKILLIPEVNATKYLTDEFVSPFVRLNVSPKTITPQLGVSFVLIEAGVGYGISMGESSLYNTQGFRANITFNYPLF